MKKLLSIFVIITLLTGCINKKTNIIDITKKEDNTFTMQLPTQPKIANYTQKIQVHFIDVGNGDSIFIDCGEYDILIDAGNNDNGQLVVDYLNKFNVDDIEILVATHNHKDHIGGLDNILKAFKVEKVIDSGEKYTSKTYKAYFEAVKNEDCEYLKDDDMTFNITERIKFEIIETGDKFKNRNDLSVISKLTYDEISFLFTGDIGEDAEKQIFDKNIDSDILKVAHHGEKTSSSIKFLEKVTPQMCIISVGENNKYTSPHEETIKRLQQYTYNICSTKDYGNIIIQTNGKEYYMEADK